MNKLTYDITNLIVLILISTGVYLHFDIDIALIVTGGLGLLLNLVTLHVATRKK